MKSSEFQFITPCLSKLDFKINNDYDDKEEEIQLGLHVKVNKERVGECEAVVELEVIIGTEDNTAPFYIHISEGSLFRWEQGVYSEPEIEALLSQNAPALLLAYIRPIVANITGASKYASYNIPFVNFMD